MGLVGPNGAGKTTLLSLAVGLLTPTRGSITVLGGRPGDGPAQLEKVGFVAQDTPAYNSALTCGRRRAHSLAGNGPSVVPIGYAVFAFALGLTTGLIFRRMLPAMLTALVGFIAAREAVTAWVRPHLFTPLHQSLPITTATPVSIDQTSPGIIKAFENTRGISIPDAWVYSVQIVDQADQAAIWSERAGPIAHPPERAHPANKQPQAPGAA